MIFIILLIGSMLLWPITGSACTIVPTFEQSVIRPLIILAITVLLAVYALFSICRRNGRVWWKYLTPVYFIVLAFPLSEAVSNYNPSGAVDCNMTFGVNILEAALISLSLWVILVVAHIIAVYYEKRTQI